MSGKPGRPPEDRLRRQHEIFLAVAPLIERCGAKRLTMRQAARAAHLSLGGLYHYFPTKRDLVLHALKPEAVARVCAEFHGRHADLERTHSHRYVQADVQGWPATVGKQAPAERLKVIALTDQSGGGR